MSKCSNSLVKPDQAVQLLEPRRQLMDELVTNLIEMESLSGDEFRERVERFEAHVTILLLSLANNQPPATAERC